MNYAEFVRSTSKDMGKSRVPQKLGCAMAPPLGTRCMPDGPLTNTSPTWIVIYQTNCWSNRIRKYGDLPEKKLGLGSSCPTL